MKTTTILTMILLIATMSAATAEDAPAMWMEQTPDGMIDLMVNTSEESSGVNAWIHFDPECINITDMDFTDSPWPPMTEPGWSHQGNHTIMALINFDGVAPGEYKIATMQIECTTDDCTSEIGITKAEPTGVVVHNTTYTCSGAVDEEAVISIGDGTGTVTIPIMIDNAENVGAVDVTMNYDPTVVTVTGVGDGAMDCTYTNNEHVDEGWIRVGAVQGDNLGLNGEFVLLNINFSSVTSGASCPLTLEVTTYKDATPNCTAMSYTIVNGVYTATQNGDVNGDDEVDIADAMYIAKYVLGMEGYETIDEGAADVNGDGIVDMSDSMYLTKHVLGMAGFEELR